MEMTEIRTRLAQTNDDPFTKGIFHALKSKNAFNWLKDTETEGLDLEYYWNKSGAKYISPLFEKLYQKEVSGTIESALSYLADILIRKYEDKWNRLYNALVNTDYNPIDNYLVEETENVGTKVEVTSEGDADTYAFNDENPTPTQKATSKQVSQGDLEDNVRQLHKRGNIGVTSTQQMLSQEIDLRKWNFYVSLMTDIDDTLCTSLY